jgi:hypothetical protein
LEGLPDTPQDHYVDQGNGNQEKCRNRGSDDSANAFNEIELRVRQKSGPKKNRFIMEREKRADPGRRVEATQKAINSNRTVSELLRRSNHVALQNLAVTVTRALRGSAGRKLPRSRVVAEINTSACSAMPQYYVTR